MISIEAPLKYLGYARDEVIGKRPEDFWDNHTRDFHFANRRHLSFEVELKTKSGALAPILFNRSIILDSEGRNKGYVCFLTDLTELKATQRELIKAETRYRIIYENAVQGLFLEHLGRKAS